MDKIFQLIVDNLLSVVGVISSLIALGVVVISYNKILNWVSDLWGKRTGNIFTHGRINKAIQEVISNLNSDLSALRGEFGADRAYIFEFHNGSQFASKMPQWRVSQTYEKVGAGVTYEGHNLQNIPATLIWDDFLKIFFVKDINEELPAGISRYVRHPACKMGCVIPRSVYLVRVEEMDIAGGPVRAMLEKQGIRYMIQAPIVTAKGFIVGWVGLDYCDDEDIDLKDLDTCKLCRYASQVALTWEIDTDAKERILQYQKKMWVKNS